MDLETLAALCRCGHPRQVHAWWRWHTRCGCGCRRFYPAGDDSAGWGLWRRWRYEVRQRGTGRRPWRQWAGDALIVAAILAAYLIWDLWER
jgi:hypothetical protein